MEPAVFQFKVRNAPLYDTLESSVQDLKPRHRNYVDDEEIRRYEEKAIQKYHPAFSFQEIPVPSGTFHRIEQIFKDHPVFLPVLS